MTRAVKNPIAILRWGGALAVVCASLIGCAPHSTATRPSAPVPSDGPPLEHVDVSKIPDAVPKHEPVSKYGNPASYEVFGKRYTTLTTSEGFVERGIGSWYGRKFHGQRTSSGEPYDMHAMTAAHKHLPLPTYARVTNLENGRSVVVKINDRGPFHEGRIIDLSYAAAVKLGYSDKGTAPVEVVALTPSGTSISTKAMPQASNGVFVQVGAFSSRDNAEELQRRLAHVPAPIKIKEEQSRSAFLYRVRIGPLASASSADTISQSLRELGLQPYIIVE